MAGPTITVFGGTGFLGRHIVRDLRDAGYAVRIAARRADTGGTQDDQVTPVVADIRDDESVLRAVKGADGVVNAVGLYVERGRETFDSIHVDGACRVATGAEAVNARLIHISGIGADPASSSAYVRARASGEAAVRRACPKATILRPSVLFGAGDAFLNTIAGLLRVLPVFPLFGDGGIRLQPVHVDDVAEAVSQVLLRPDSAGLTYELGGPDVMTWRALVELVMERTGRRRLLLRWPFALWELQARLASLLPDPPLTRDQIALLRQDNVASEELPGLADLGITPTSLEAILALHPWEPPRQP